MDIFITIAILADLFAVTGCGYLLKRSWWRPSDACLYAIWVLIMNILFLAYGASREGLI